MLLASAGAMCRVVCVCRLVCKTASHRRTRCVAAGGAICDLPAAALKRPQSTTTKKGFQRQQIKAQRAGPVGRPWRQYRADSAYALTYAAATIYR